MPDRVGTVLRAASARLIEELGATGRLDAEVLMAHVVGVSRTALLVHSERQLDDDELCRFEALVQRRLAREPVAYITGTAEFWSLTFAVTPAVLIPRPETEHVVQACLEVAPAGAGGRLLDLGTGCGAIAAALAVERPHCEIVATDLSEAALEVAHANLERLGLLDRVSLRRGDLFAPIGDDERFLCIASNPPYVATGDRSSLMSDVVDYEPHEALFSGDDGLTCTRRLVEQAPSYLAPGGLLVFEVASERAGEVLALLGAGPFVSFGVATDYRGRKRIATARVRG